MIAHRRGRIVVIAEDKATRRPIRLTPRPVRATAGDGGTVIAPAARTEIERI